MPLKVCCWAELSKHHVGDDLSKGVVINGETVIQPRQQGKLDDKDLRKIAQKLGLIPQNTPTLAKEGMPTNQLETQVNADGTFTATGNRAEYSISLDNTASGKATQLFKNVQLIND